jgi:bifunctional DNA primase/polymerase-like protein
MTPAIETAVRYAGKGWPVFPCRPWPDKSPYVDGGFHAASTDSDQILAWWMRWPDAIIAVPTGERIGLVVLDVDTKRGVDGWATLAALEGCPIPPATPTVITASGGAHLYYQRPADGVRNTTGQRGRGIGPGLDWRGDGGYVIVPTPGTDYRWGPLHFGNCAPLPAPPRLLPREPERAATAEPIRPARGLSPYASAALDQACRRIAAAPGGEQETTLNGEVFSIGTLAGAGAIPADFARRSLQYAAAQMTSHDPAHPWRASDIEIKVDRAFRDGMQHPRKVRHA